MALKEPGSDRDIKADKDKKGPSGRWLNPESKPRSVGSCSTEEAPKARGLFAPLAVAKDTVIYKNDHVQEKAKNISILRNTTKKATGTQTSINNSADKKGDKVAVTQSAEAEEASEVEVKPDLWKHTKVPFGLKKLDAAKWLARRAMGISEQRLAQELRAFQFQRKHHEMWLSITLEALDTGRTRAIKGLLDNGCTTTCMDRDYAAST